MNSRAERHSRSSPSSSPSPSLTMTWAGCIRRSATLWTCSWMMWSPASRRASSSACRQDPASPKSPHGGSRPMRWAGSRICRSSPVHTARISQAALIEMFNASSILKASQRSSRMSVCPAKMCGQMQKVLSSAHRISSRSSDIPAPIAQPA